MKAYFIMRKDLNMTPAKLAVQVGHGTQYIMRNSMKDDLDEWETLNDSRKIVCEISSEEKLNNLYEFLKDKLQVNKIIDSGYTEFNEPTFTGISFLLNIDDAEVFKKLKRLQLYKGY